MGDKFNTQGLFLTAQGVWGSFDPTTQPLPSLSRGWSLEPQLRFHSRQSWGSCWPFDKHVFFFFFADSSLLPTRFVAQILSTEHWIPARKAAPNFGSQARAIRGDAVGAPLTRVPPAIASAIYAANDLDGHHTPQAGHPPSATCSTFCPFGLFLLFFCSS